MRAALTLALALGLLAAPMLVQAHDAADQEEQRLPTIGTAADFALISQDRAKVTLKSLRGKVVAVAFIYTWCPDVCPFLTGAPAAVREVAQKYGVAVAPGPDGQVDHTLLTTLVDRHGIMRVQYLGYRFDPEEFR